MTSGARTQVRKPTSRSAPGVKIFAPHTPTRDPAPLRSPARDRPGPRDGGRGAATAYGCIFAIGPCIFGIFMPRKEKCSR